MDTKRYKYQTASPIDWNRTKEVTGVVMGKTTVTIGKRQVAAIQIHTGKATQQVLGSARLAGAIDAAEVGDMIHIVNNGTIKLKGGRKMHDFAVEVYEGDSNAKGPKAPRARKASKPRHKTASAAE